VKTIYAALAAIILSGLVWSSPAEARCWWNGYRWHCTHHRYYTHYRPYYRPYYYGYYPAYYPYYYRPYYCFPIWPFCG
jgi:hypothetical protein